MHHPAAVATLRAPLALRVSLLVALLLAVPASRAYAQQRDSVRAAVEPPRDSARRRLPVADTIPGPPVSPRRAFLSSLLVPGLGQASLDRPVAGSIFVAVEILAITMWRKSAAELRYAKRVGGIGVPCPGVTDGQLCLDPGPPVLVGNPPVVTYPNASNPNRYSGGRLAARRQHVEDWVALLLANHLFAGADAYVAAHLWDQPARVSVRPAAGGVALAARVEW